MQEVIRVRPSPCDRCPCEGRGTGAKARPRGPRRTAPSVAGGGSRQEANRGTQDSRPQAPEPRSQSLSFKPRGPEHCRVAPARSPAVTRPPLQLPALSLMQQVRTWTPELQDKTKSPNFSWPLPANRQILKITNFN